VSPLAEGLYPLVMAVGGILYDHFVNKCPKQKLDKNDNIGSRMSAISGDMREAAFLLQRFSMANLAIYRFNLVPFIGTFPSATDVEASPTRQFINKINNI